MRFFSTLFSTFQKCLSNLIITSCFIFSLISFLISHFLNLCLSSTFFFPGKQSLFHFTRPPFIYSSDFFYFIFLHNFISCVFLPNIIPFTFSFSHSFFFCFVFIFILNFQSSCYDHFFSIVAISLKTL